MNQPANNHKPDLDRVAVVLSGLCIVHCLALPILLIAVPVMAEFASTHWHLPMLLFAVPVSVVAIVMGYRRHGNLAIVGWAALGLALLIAGATVGHNFFGPAADRSLTVAGSLLLAAVHWQNSRQMRSHNRGGVALAES